MRRFQFKEAIVDEPSQSLSDIFDQQGKLKQEVVDTIQRAIQEIKSQFPNLQIEDYFVVGAAVTYQYSPNSDIDTTLVVPNAPNDLFKQVDDWIGQNIDPKYKFGSRPYQFKVSRQGRNQIAAFDAVYDIGSQVKTGMPSWIKKPDPNKSQLDFKRFITDEQSKEHNLYKSIEKTIKPSIEELFELIKNSGGNLTEEIKRQTLAVLHRYKLVKNMRSKSYDSQQTDPRDQGKISRNWGIGNIIYKFLDREGYIELFQTLKKLVESQFQNFKALFGSLTSLLQRVVRSTIGFTMPRIQQQTQQQTQPMMQTASVSYNRPLISESGVKRVLIIDVESTCDDTGPITNEIIEIGMADTGGKSFPSIFIKPEHSTVTKYCTNLTSLTPEQIEKLGKTPKEAYAQLNKIFSQYQVWASYGEYDRIMMEKMQSLYGLSLNMPQHQNIRLLFAQKVLNSNDPHAAPKNPKDALEMLKIPFRGFNHRGEDDAVNLITLYNVINDESALARHLR